MGTVFSFDLRARRTPEVVEALLHAVAWLHHVDAVFSTYRPGSQISRLRRAEITVQECEPEVAEVLTLCEELGEASDGWFSCSPEGTLDPTGLVKGWATERASQILYEAGVHHHCVNGGGDVQLRDEAGSGQPWRVGIADPLRPGRLVTVVTGRDLAVATSGTAERGDHIIDPHRGRPAAELLAITLVGRHLTEVDALATAACAMGDAARAWVTARPDLEAFAVTSDARIWHTAGFPGEINPRMSCR